MKSVFDMDQYNENTVMYCETEEEARVFQQYLDLQGKRWSSGATYLDEFGWRPSFPCYRFHRGVKGPLDLYLRDAAITILRFCDFDWGMNAEVESEGEMSDDAGLALLLRFLSLYDTNKQEGTP